jgi:hypothetical protein
MPYHRGVQFVSDEDDDDDEGTVIYSRISSSASLRSRLMVTKGCEPKTITTTPGLLGAGETETESEDQPVCARLASTSQCKSSVIPFFTVAATSHCSYCQFLWATDPSDNAATASHAIALFLFTLALDCSCFSWNALQHFLCYISSSTTGRSSDRLYRFCPMGEPLLRPFPCLY